MKYISIILTFICFTSYAQSQSTDADLDCSVYRKGRFVVSADEGDEIFIKRTKRYQYEKYNKSGKKHKFKIVWTNDCAYILILKKTTSKRNESYIGKGLFSTILSGEDDYDSCMVITPEHPSGRICEVTKLR